MKLAPINRPTCFLGESWPGWGRGRRFGSEFKRPALIRRIRFVGIERVVPCWKVSKEGREGGRGGGRTHSSNQINFSIMNRPPGWWRKVLLLALLERTASRKSLMPLEAVRVSWISDDRRGVGEHAASSSNFSIPFFDDHRFRR